MNLIRLVVFFLAILVAIPSYIAGKYFYYASLFAESIERREVIPAREHLQEVQYYTSVAKRIPFGEYFADKYLFNDSWYFENSFNYTRGDYDTVIDNLDGKQDYRAQHLVANSLFRNDQKEYRSTDDPKKKAEIVDRSLNVTAPYYERSIKMMDENTSLVDQFKDKWNYDLLSNPSSAAGALGNEEKMPVYILGIPGGDEEEGIGPEGKGEEGEGDLFDTTVPEEGAPPRKKRG